MDSRVVVGKTTKPNVIGLYGLPGSGKTYFLDLLRSQLDPLRFKFFEGSEVISSMCPGGLESFKSLSEPEKWNIRRHSIKRIQLDCATEMIHTGIVTGHLIFWDEGSNLGQSVQTKVDLDVYTHILYLAPPVETIQINRLRDDTRDRAEVSKDHLIRWQIAERNHLRKICMENNILFINLQHDQLYLDNILRLIKDMDWHNGSVNLQFTKQRLGEILPELQVKPGRIQLKEDGKTLFRRHELKPSSPTSLTILFDADKTLAPADSGQLCCGSLSRTLTINPKDYLKKLFSSPLGYSYSAFRQAVLMYEEVVDEDRFDEICTRVSSEAWINIHPEIVNILRLAEKQEGVCVILITCGIRRVWEKVLEREGLSESVKVIGGGRISDRLVVTPESKEHVVKLIQAQNIPVWAFGDSPLDLKMLQAADRAVVVTGEAQGRSQTMEQALRDTIGKDGFQPSQALLPPDCLPRLDDETLPLVNLTSKDFFMSALRPFFHDKRVNYQIAPYHVSRYLMTPMRDSFVSGPALRKSHHSVGWYLAVQMLTSASVIGLETFPSQNVQGISTEGYRVSHEWDTLIVALMRGGEPMASGVSEAIPRAAYLHARSPDDITEDHLKRLVNIILVDSVINNGTTMKAFLKHVRQINATVNIVVVAGVIQEEVLRSNVLTEGLDHTLGLNVVALRVSANKYTGRGRTDTGNRLFNTVPRE